MSRIVNYISASGRGLVWRGLVNGAAFCACLALATAAHASVIAPQLPEFVLEATVSGSCSDAAPATPAPEDNAGDQEQSWLASLGWGAHNSTSGPASSSVPSPADGGNPLVLGKRADHFLADPLLVGWLTSGSRLELPLPPANSLLRPPQV